MPQSPTTYMNLVLPIVNNPSTDPGPGYATTLNVAFASGVDGHDHSTGKGTKVTPAGININQALSFNGNDLTNAVTINTTNLAASFISGSTLVGNLSGAQGSGLTVSAPTGTFPVANIWDLNVGNGGISVAQASGSNAIVISAGSEIALNNARGNILGDNNATASFAGGGVMARGLYAGGDGMTSAGPVTFTSTTANVSASAGVGTTLSFPSASFPVLNANTVFIGGGAASLYSLTVSGTTYSSGSTFLAGGYQLSGSTNTTIGGANGQFTNGYINTLTPSVVRATGGGAAFAGTGTLVAGNAIVVTSAVTANSLIFLTSQATASINTGALTACIKYAGSKFGVSSSLVSDTSTFAWFLIN